MNAQVLKKLLEQDEPPAGQIIATNIVAFAGVSAGYEDAVSTLKECVQDKQGIDPA